MLLLVSTFEESDITPQWRYITAARHLHKVHHKHGYACVGKCTAHSETDFCCAYLRIWEVQKRHADEIHWKGVRQMNGDLLRGDPCKYEL